MGCLLRRHQRWLGVGLAWLMGCGDDAADGPPAFGSPATDESEASPGSGSETGGGAQGGSDADPDPTPDGATGGGASATTGIPCAVQAVLEEHCWACHSDPPQFGASVALAHQADFLAASPTQAERARFEVALDRITQTDPALQMPPSSRPALDGEALSSLRAWLDAGAPASSEACQSAQPPPESTGGDVDVAGLDCYKLVAHAEGDKNARYRVGVANDAYRNFTFAAPWGNKPAYAVVARPVIDNRQVLHHWLLFRESGPVPDGGVAVSSGAHPSGELVHGWAPGGTALDFRKHGDVAFEFPAGTHFTVEMHYNSSDPSALDASGVEVCIQEEKPAKLAGISWLGTDALFLTSSAQSTCVPQSPQEIHILGVSPHMHPQGRHMTAIIQRADGSQDVLHDAPFDFQDQAWYEREAVLYPGDTITTRCDYAGPVSFGPGTNDEMCYLFTVAYPKGALADGKLIGTLTHGGGACLGM